MNIYKKLSFCGLLFGLSIGQLYAQLQSTHLRTEYKINPFVDTEAPRLSWELEGSGFNRSQTAYQIQVSSDLAKLEKNQADLWDTDKVISSQTNQIDYKGKKLSSGQEGWWRVRTWDENGRVGPWSSAAKWELGKLKVTDWQAQWIGYDTNPFTKRNTTYHLPPSPYLRTQKKIEKDVESARLYIASLGLHEFYVNGEKIGNDYFGSGWTDYNKRIYYNVYDITPHISKGDNVFGSILAPGWYAGYLGYALLVGSPQVNQFYGKYPLLKAQIEITYRDGSKDTIKTDQSWKAQIGAIQEADFLQGELYDANKELIGWDQPLYDDKEWKEVQVTEKPTNAVLSLYPSNPVRVIDKLNPKTIKAVKDDVYIVDFGQNFAGNIQVHVKGSKGDTLTFRYGEMCHPDGRLMTENLRSARATDYYVLRGDPNGETWTPKFTFHGFQYVEVSGLKVFPQKDFIQGLVLSSDLQEVGRFQSDNTMLNQLYSNIVWTQRANYLDIPTDCPQRDERLGWTGDAQVYMRSAAFNVDIAPFHTKWIQDLHDSQWPSGAYPVYAPMPVNARGEAAIRASDTFSPGWSEAGIICTYEIYRTYNDTRIVELSMPYMIRFMDFLQSRAQQGIFKEGSFEDISPKGGFADWLSVGKKTSPDLLASMYYYYCAKLMAEMSLAINRDDLQAKYATVMQSIKDAFKRHYMSSDNRLKSNAAYYGNGDGYVDGQLGFTGHTQTAYANALYFGILEEEDAVAAGNYLRQLIIDNDNKLTTGFLGFKPLLPALSQSGSSDKAYSLLLSTEYPSLGYEVINGATSIWERWDSYIQGEGFRHNAAMNSFSHYAFGAVNEWMFENMIGIKALLPGYNSILIRPEIEPNTVGSVEGSYHAIAGLIKSSWKLENKHVTQSFSIPINVNATIVVPIDATNIKLNNESIDRHSLVKKKEIVGNEYRLMIGSGNYSLTYTK